MNENLKTGLIVAGAGGAAYIIYDITKNAIRPETGSVSMVQQVAQTVVQTLAPGDVPTVRIGMPIMTLPPGAAGPQNITDSPNTSNNNLKAISELCKQILCNNSGSGDTAATFASCESQDGNLRNCCFNCSLFNILWRSADNAPRVRIGRDFMPSFRTGKASDVDGFRACIQHFKGWCERNSPAMLAAIRANNPDAFQIALGQSPYNRTYTATIANGQILPGRNFIRQRYDRLKSAGLL